MRGESTNFHVLLVGLALAGCMSSCSSTLAIRTDPEGAWVGVTRPKDGERVGLGVAPILLSERELAQATGLVPESNELVELWAEMPGYRSERFLIAPNRLAALSSALTVRLERIGSRVGATPVGQALSHYFAARDFLRANAAPRALVAVDRAIAADPDFARAAALKAEILAKLGRAGESQLWYASALRLAPEMGDVKEKLVPAAAPAAKPPAPGNARGESP